MALGSISSSSNRAKRLGFKSAQHKQLACVAFFGIVSIVTIVVGILLGWFLRVQSFNGIDADPSSNGKRTITLFAELKQVDPIAGQLIMNWEILDDSCFSSITDIDNATPNDVPAACTTVNIFFDQNLIVQLGDNAQTNRTNGIPTNPVFIWVPQAEFEQEGSLAAFRTTIQMFAKSTKSGQSHTLQDYPFDTYQAFIALEANDTSNTPVNLFKNETTGVAVGFSTSFQSFPTDDGSIENQLTFSRSSLVKAYALLIVIGVWLIALAFLASVIKELFGYRQQKDVYVVPMATLFAVTSIRSSMPGAPDGFGAIIDFVGILPCIGIITVTGVILFAVLVLLDPEGVEHNPPIFKRVNTGSGASYSGVSMTD